MTEKQIVALLNEPSGSEENLEALAKEDFAKVGKGHRQKIYTKEEIYDTFEKLAKAEAEMVAAVRKKYGVAGKGRKYFGKGNGEVLQYDCVHFDRFAYLSKAHSPDDREKHPAPRVA